MQNNYYFLRQFTQQLARRLGSLAYHIGYRPIDETQLTKGMRLGACFSQNKDELVLGFFSLQEELYLRALLNPELACLAVVSDFQRAKRNSIDLFRPILNKAVVAITQYQNERSFALHFEEGHTLLFKMHGRRANVILFEQEQFLISFHKRMENDYQLKLAALDRPLVQTFEAYQAVEGNLAKIYPTLGTEIKAYLDAQPAFVEADLPERWAIVERLVTQLENPKYYLWQPQEAPQLMLLPPPEQTTPFEVFEEAHEAVNAFFFAYLRLSTLTQEKSAAQRLLQRRLRQAQAYVQKHTQRLRELDEGIDHETTGHLLMAHLHQIPQGETQVVLPDFYDPQQMHVIKLKKDLSPQKNAEHYYRKAKNQKIERTKLQDNIARKETEVLALETQLLALEAITQVKELRKFLKTNKIDIEAQAAVKVEMFPFKRFHYQGFEFWVGKNAKNNDLLIQKYAFKEDLWLHAKDVTGSHVLIKYQAGKPFPKDVIEKAASLAAYYSKRSHDSVCPVIVTPRKYVRKTKDLPDGQVIVEREEVVMVLPEAFGEG